MKKLNIFLLIALSAASLLLYTESCSKKKLKAEINSLKTNIDALTDTVRITKTKNNELEFNRKTLITTIKDLGQLNEKLAKEVKTTKGKVVYIQGTKVVVRDTLMLPGKIVHDTVTNDVYIKAELDTTYSPGNYKSTVFLATIPANSDYLQNVSLTQELGMAFITGLKKNEKGDYEILFRTDFPGIKSVVLDGAYIPKNQLKQDFKRPRLSFGIQAGYSPLSYDLKNKKLELKNQFTAGFGLNYRFIK